MKKSRLLALSTCLLGAAVAAMAGQNIVKNGSCEVGPGRFGPDPRLANHWTNFGGDSVERSNEARYPDGGAWSLKAFGSTGTDGAYQDVEASAGDSVSISTLVYTRAVDKVGGDAAAKLKLEFLDAGNTVLDAVEITVIDSSSPADTWISGAIGPRTAPSGTTKARATCVFTYGGSSAGAAYWDACTLTIDGGQNLLLNGGFEEEGERTSGYNANGLTFWKGFGKQEKSADQAWDCEYSVLVTADSENGFSGLYQDTADLEAGDRIFAAAKVFIPAGGLTNDSGAAIKLEFQPGGGKEVPPPVENLAFGNDSPKGEWVNVSLSVEVPEGITLARLVVLAFDEVDTNGPVYADSAVAERSSDPGTNQFKNASFESGTSGKNGLTNWTEFAGLNCRARKSSDFKRDGDFSLKIQGSCTAGLYQEIEVAPGETLEVSAYFFSNPSQPFNDPNSKAGVKIEWKAGNLPKQVDIFGAPNNTVTSSSPQGQWVPIWIDYTMPAGSAARIRVTGIVGVYSGSVALAYFDGFEAVVMNRYDGDDVDIDFDEDLIDFARMQTNFSGSGGGLGWNGITYDSDEDSDVDSTDWDYFAPRFTGPAN